MKKKKKWGVDDDRVGDSVCSSVCLVFGASNVLMAWQGNPVGRESWVVLLVNSRDRQQVMFLPVCLLLFAFPPLLWVSPLIGPGKAEVQHDTPAAAHRAA